MSRCGCGGACTCALTAGDDVLVTGSGTPANPWVVSALTDCGEVRDCLSGNQGVDYDPDTGVISACVSPDAGNALVRDANGCLYVQLGASTVTTGCGLSGTGAPGDPLRPSTVAWPYPCNIATESGIVVCDPATGLLRGEPRSHAGIQTVFFDEDFANLPVPAAPGVPIRTVIGFFTNPDPCRGAIVLASQEVEFGLDLPPGAGAEYGFDGDLTVRHTNTGSSTESQFHVQSTKLVSRGAIAPGATNSYSFDALLGRGTNGATYTHLQGILRIIMITQ